MNSCTFVLHVEILCHSWITDDCSVIYGFTKGYIKFTVHDFWHKLCIHQLKKKKFTFPHIINSQSQAEVYFLDGDVLSTPFFYNSCILKESLMMNPRSKRQVWWRYIHLEDVGTLRVKWVIAPFNCDPFLKWMACTNSCLKCITSTLESLGCFSKLTFYVFNV